MTKDLRFAVGIIIIAVTSGVFCFRSTPYFRGKWHEMNLGRRMDVAEKKVRELQGLVHSDRRFDEVQFYAWPMDGVMIVFTGAVSNSQDLRVLKTIIQSNASRMSIKWNITNRLATVK